jgi:transglutaminase-like putative cysteine protease
VRLPLAGALFALVIAHYGTPFGREPGTELAIGILVLKLLETERIRDARVVVAFSAFVLMSALLANQGLVFTALVCLALVVLLGALVSLQPGSVVGIAGGVVALRARLEPFRVGARLLGVGVPLALAAFVFIPRLSAPWWGAPGEDSARTGLSDRMAPGSMTDLLIDDTPAFRASFTGAPPAPAERYFRAVVMTDFDGHAWTRGRPRWHRASESLEPRVAPIAYELTLEPGDGPWLPALDMPLAPPDGAYMTSDHSLVLRGASRTPRSFPLEAALRYRLAAQLGDAQRARFLALPDRFDPRSRELARRWREELGEDAAIVRAALAMFRADFTYTLSAPLLGRDSVDDFLFGTRAGFCEHFSSSFTFLMRAAGIPARVVTGYQGGAWIAGGDYLLVRRSDAHAWSEVWLDGRGWVRVDPTAAVSPARVELGADAVNGGGGWIGRGWMRGLRDAFDRVERAWTNGVIKFDALRQRSLFSPFGIARVEQRNLWLGFAGALALVLVAATLWALRGERERSGDALDRAWQRLGRRMARAGLARQPNEGPHGWLARVGAQVADPAFTELVADYVSLRYATAAPPRANIDRFAAAVRRFRMPRGAPAASRSAGTLEK